MDFSRHTSRIIARLGVPVSVTPSGQPVREVVGVFTQSPEVAFGLIEGSRPTVRLTTLDASGIVDGDPVNVGLLSYTVKKTTPNAVAGDVLIELESA